MQRIALLLVVMLLAAVGCSEPHNPAMPSSTGSVPPTSVAAPAERALSADPAKIADDLVADEHALRDPASSEDLLTAAAQRQQMAYRIIARHQDWDAITRPRIPAALLGSYDRNIDARRHLEALSKGTLRDLLPAWRIGPPRPADELLGYYREAESATGVGWSYLAAINLIETGLGRVAGTSTAGAQGPMQFLPSTFATYGDGGDINAPRDSIMAAGRFLAAHGFALNRDDALFRYNNSMDYVRAVDDYAAVLAADPGAFAGYYRWQVYYRTTTGDVLLPVGYAETDRITVAEYRARQSGATPAHISGGSEQILERLLAANGGAGAQSEPVSRQFLGTPYGANTLIGSESVPEQLVVDLEKVDCFTYADYVEALKRAKDRAGFITALIEVRYKNGVVSFATRKHFFTDWSAVTPAVGTDITTTLGAEYIPVPKQLNQKDAGGVYLPGLPVIPRTISYIPSGVVDSAVVSRLRSGDYIGAYAQDGGLDVTHVGIFVNAPQGPVLRNASSLQANEKVVDQPLFDYLHTVPGIVVLRPVQ